MFDKMSRAVCRKKDVKSMEKNKSVLYLEMYLYTAKKLIIKKDCTLQDLKEAENYLNKCRGIAPSEEARIDIWTGKLELKRSKLTNDGLDKRICLTNAQNSFFMSLAKNPCPSAFYGIFKISISLNDWASAKVALTEYEKSDKKNRYNFRLVHKLLDSCIGEQKEYPLTRSDYIFGNRVDSKSLIENYHLAELAFDNGELNKCLKHLTVCHKLAKLRGITIDFAPILELVNELVKINNLTVIDELKLKVLKADNLGEKIPLIRSLLAVHKEAELYFLLIDSYIGLGGYACIPDILEELKQLELSEIDKKKIALYENICKEQMGFSKNILIINRQLDNAQSHVDAGNIVGAYSSYVDGLNGSGHSIFLSKLGDLFYSNGYYKKAEEFYLEYLNKGYENLYSVYISLYKIYRHLNNTKKASDIVIESFNSLLLTTRGYSLASWSAYLDSEYASEVTVETQVSINENQMVLMKQ